MSKDPEGHTIVFVEFQDGRPSTVISEEANGGQNCYDFEWCERDRQLYYNMSGFGSTRDIEVSAWEVYWMSSAMKAKVQKNKTRLHKGQKKGRRLARMPRGYPLGRLFEDAEESSTEYCSVCDDYLPVSETDHPCGHIWFCDEVGQWSTPDERCPDDCQGEDCIEDRASRHMKAPA
jgi:hypothetical protein